jgi:excisionase family DNA binding protein
MQLVLKPEEAAVALGISRAKCYALMARGDLPTILVGASRRIPVAALQDWIEQRVAMCSVSAA